MEGQILFWDTTYKALTTILRPGLQTLNVGEPRMPHLSGAVEKLLLKKPLLHIQWPFQYFF